MKFSSSRVYSKEVKSLLFWEPEYSIKNPIKSIIDFFRSFTINFLLINIEYEFGSQLTFHNNSFFNHIKNYGVLMILIEAV